MRYFPMFLDLAGRPVLLAGGGEQMAQKARLMLRTGARLTVMAPALDDELAGLVAAGRLAHLPAVYDQAAVDAAALVFAASGCVGIDAMIAARARCPVNVVDRPALCTVITPAIVDRDPLVIAIGTEGAAPVMAREVKSRLEAMLEPDLGGLVALAGRLRGLVADHVPARARRAFWEAVFAGPPRRLWADGRRAEAEAAIRAAALAGAPPRAGALSLIDMPAAVDLLPLRAVARLQAADLILHGDGAEAVLELARRDAGRGPMPADPAVLVEALGAGQRVVVLLGEGQDAALPPGMVPERIAPAPASAPDQEAG
jgi:uroporphyrin-III C-methyltransferase / precorrin-2 dehydrogenase / sirohydrochlorin ferrochelatase